MMTKKQIKQVEGIVFSSRIRLARNFKGFNFPGVQDTKSSKKILKTLQENFLKLPIDNVKFVLIHDLSSLERLVLVEKNQISPSLADNINSASVISESSNCSIMINEEDHLRIQCIDNGWKLRGLWESANELDDILNDNIPFAYSAKFGYLTACPSNLGTGLRASVMLSLLGLELCGELKKVQKGLSKLGYAVRGWHGEGSEAVGNIFQISNQITLGVNEEEIINDLENMLLKVFELEMNALNFLLRDNKEKLYDVIARSVGILKYSYTINTKEALSCLSVVRTGVYLGIIKFIKHNVINDLFQTIQPGHLQEAYKGLSEPEARDKKRAEILRTIFNKK